MVLLPILNRFCLSAVAPIVPGVVTLIVNTLHFLNSTHPSLSKSDSLAIVLPLMLLRSGMNSPVMCATQLQLPPSGKSSELTWLQRSIHHSLQCHPCVSLVWPGYVIGFRLIDLFYVQMRLWDCYSWRLSVIKSPHKIRLFKECQWGLQWRNLYILQKRPYFLSSPVTWQLQRVSGCCVKFVL